MVSLEAVRASNAKLKNLPPGLVALFGQYLIFDILCRSSQALSKYLRLIAVGATSGIGETTLKQFYRQTNRPRVYFVGRYGKLLD